MLLDATLLAHWIIVYNMTLNANCGLLVCTKDSFSKCFANGHGEGESKCQ